MNCQIRWDNLLSDYYGTFVNLSLTLNITSPVFLFVEAKIDLGFLIDGSANVGEQNFRISLNFMKNIYGAFWTQFGSLHLGLVVFGTETRLIFNFDNKYADKIGLNNAINNAAFPGGRTVVLGEALRLTETHLFGSKHHDSYRRILVVMLGSTSEDDVFLAAEMLKANGVTVFCVGVGNHYVRAQMDGIASQPSSDNTLTAVTYASLTSLTQKLIDKINEGKSIRSTSSLTIFKQFSTIPIRYSVIDISFTSIPQLLMLKLYRHSSFRLALIVSRS